MFTQSHYDKITAVYSDPTISRAMNRHDAVLGVCPMDTGKNIERI